MAKASADGASTGRACFVGYLETFGFGCLVTAAAGLLPLVMMLHR